MRFVGLALHETVPDAKTIWLYREHLSKAGALKRAFDQFDTMLRDRGYLAMGGQIVDATVIEARRPRLNAEEKAIVRGGGTPSAGRRHAPGRSTGKVAGRSSATASRHQHLAKRRGRPSARSPCRCSATRTTSALIARTASSVVSPSRMPRAMTAASLPRCSIPTMPPAACGRILLIAARSMCDCSTAEAW